MVHCLDSFILSEEANLGRLLPKEYTQKGNLRPFRLSKSDLLKLESIIREGSSDNVTWSISTEFGKERVSENSVEDFFKHDDLPKRFHYLSLYFSDWKRGMTIHVYIIGLWLRQLEVSGSNQAWVLGKFGEIQEFFRKRSVGFWPVYLIFPWVALIILYSLGIVVPLLFLGRLSASVAVSGTAVFLALLLGIGFFLRVKGKFLPNVTIITVEDKSLLKSPELNAVIGLGLLIVTILLLLVAVLK